jgi:hypothetical protein
MQEVEEVSMVIIGSLPFGIFVITALFVHTLFSPPSGYFLKLFSWIPFAYLVYLFKAFMNSNLKNHAEYLYIYEFLLPTFFIFGILNLFSLRVSPEHLESLKYKTWTFIFISTILEILASFSLVSKRKYGMFEMNYFLIIGFGILYGMNSIHFENLKETLPEKKFIFFFSVIFISKVVFVSFFGELFSKQIPEGETILLVYLYVIGVQSFFFLLFFSSWFGKFLMRTIQFILGLICCGFCCCKSKKE